MSFKQMHDSYASRVFIPCSECGKRRVVYAAKRLTSREETSLQRVQEELQYTCGSPLLPSGPLSDVLVVREGITCERPMESTYYSGI